MMGLIKDKIKNDIIAAHTQVMHDESEDRAGAIDTYAEILANAVINAIKSMDIIYVSGLTNGGGAVTGKAIFKIE